MTDDVDGEYILEQYRIGVLSYEDALIELERLGYILDDAIARLDYA